MDLLLFDVLWHTQMHVGFSGTVEVLSAYGRIAVIYGER